MEWDAVGCIAVCIIGRSSAAIGHSAVHPVGWVTAGGSTTQNTTPHYSSARRDRNSTQHSNSARQFKARQGKARQGKARQGKARHGKTPAREDKGKTVQPKGDPRQDKPKATQTKGTPTQSKAVPATLSQKPCRAGDTRYVRARPKVGQMFIRKQHCGLHK